MASTARSTLAQAVMTTSGSDESIVWILFNKSRPSWPEVVSRS